MELFCIKMITMILFLPFAVVVFHAGQQTALTDVEIRGSVLPWVLTKVSKNSWKCILLNHYFKRPSYSSDCYKHFLKRNVSEANGFRSKKNKSFCFIHQQQRSKGKKFKRHRILLRISTMSFFPCIALAHTFTEIIDLE